MRLRYLKSRKICLSEQEQVSSVQRTLTVSGRTLPRHSVYLGICVCKNQEACQLQSFCLVLSLSSPAPIVSTCSVPASHTYMSSRLLTKLPLSTPSIRLLSKCLCVVLSHPLLVLFYCIPSIPRSGPHLSTNFVSPLWQEEESLEHQFLFCCCSPNGPLAVDAVEHLCQY